MRRVALSLLAPACAVALLLYCFRAVLFADEQFAYRDAAHFYYPLYLRVQQEWRAGRWPLWNPWQNAGMPLLGMPMAAVFYPGKLVFALLSYPWATRLYAIGHVALAFAGMVALARSWGLGPAASGLSGLGYAFGAPVLFQYCNIIYLVGASWVPWGFWALEGLLRRGSRWGLPALGVVLALQVLGGDPEAAYLTVLCGGGYALVLATPGWMRSRPVRMLRRPWVAAPLVAGWVATVGAVAYAATRLAWPAWLPGWGPLRGACWGAVGLAWAWAWWRRPREARLGPLAVAMGAACVLAMALAAVQLLPAMEYSRLSHRASEDVAMDLFHFSVEPYRLVEVIWPGAFGLTGAENRSFIQSLPPSGNHGLWTPSLYLGGLTLALALGALGRRPPTRDARDEASPSTESSPPWRTWLLWVAAIGLLASLGRFAGPLWWLRYLRGVPGMIGPHDPSGFDPRIDAYFEDGFGSPYGLMTALLPGFALFRYPGKLMTFVSLAMAGLAGLGWERLASGRTRWPRRFCAWGAATTAVVALIGVAARPRVFASLNGRLIPDTAYGPVDLSAALDGTRLALLHGGVVLAMGWALTSWAPRRPRAAGALALLLLAIDLGAADSRLIWTAPQAAFEGTSRVARLIEKAEAADRSPGPFRIHRMGLWHPEGFTKRRSPGRFAELTRWERDTLQPADALPLDLDYCLTEGVLEVLDYLIFFHPQEMTAGPEAARFLRIPEGSRFSYAPRRGFDLWNARYFILPIRTDNWKSSDRGYAAFLPETEVIYPDPKALAGPPGEPWRENEDWQILRNKDAFPRAWLVHFARVRRPPDEAPTHLEALHEKLDLLHDLIYKDDPFWRDPDRKSYNLRTMAFVETDRARDLSGYVSRLNPTPSESVRVARHDPQRVEIEAVLEHPGLVVLADAYYPGWSLTIDGAPAPIYRTNRLMRGAAVRAGRHTLVYTYDPPSFRLGAALSLLGLLALVALLPWAARGPVRAAETPDAATEGPPA